MERTAPEASPAPAGREAIRVLIVDDHELFRRGLDMVLQTEDDIEVVGEAGDGLEALTAVDELAPDVVLMDVRMPRMNGIDATRAVRDQFPMTRIVMLTVSDDEEDVYDAVRAGANGYLLKEVSIEEVAEAVRAVVRGQSLLSASLATKLLSEMTPAADPVAPAGPTAHDPALPTRPSDREIDVLKLVAVGVDTAEIAARLGTTEQTVRNRVASVLLKLQLRARMERLLAAARGQEVPGAGA